MRQIEPGNFSNVLSLVDEVPFNTLFARAVLERKADGRVFVDDLERPQLTYIAHGYGMSLLCGRGYSKDALDWLVRRMLERGRESCSFEWLQVFPRDWEETISKVLGGRLLASDDPNGDQAEASVQLNTRVNFQFSRARWLARRASPLSEGLKISPIDSYVFENMKGAVVPKLFWNDYATFERHGAGFAAFVDGQLAACAFASCVQDSSLELGIETIPEFRGIGLARRVCEQLMEHCLVRGLEPVWACRRENVASYELALSLGFEVAWTGPYYRLGG